MTTRLCLASQRIPDFREDSFHRSMLIRSNKLQNLVVYKDCGVRSPEETNPHAYIFFSLYIFKITPSKGIDHSRNTITYNNALCLSL